MKGVIRGEYRPELNITKKNGKRCTRDLVRHLREVTSGRLLDYLGFYLEEVRGQGEVPLFFWFTLNLFDYRKWQDSAKLNVAPMYGGRIEYIFRRDHDFFVNFYEDPIKVKGGRLWIPDKEREGWARGASPSGIGFVNSVNFYLSNPFNTSRAVL